MVAPATIQASNHNHTYGLPKKTRGASVASTGRTRFLRWIYGCTSSAVVSADGGVWLATGCSSSGGQLKLISAALATIGENETHLGLSALLTPITGTPVQAPALDRLTP